MVKYIVGLLIVVIFALFVVLLVRDDPGAATNVGNSHLVTQFQPPDQITRKWLEHGWHHVALITVPGRRRVRHVPALAPPKFANMVFERA